ncbi:MAG: hypothetical protein CL467_07440 [Acidimicrobiaceae bacterium]|nr:hypothetical protein [Acidimicrobiaceae bacterium]HAQ23020.1 hypothetical protein [Acidimicrobiaceae bacterium]
MISEEELQSKVGYRFPGGEYLLEPYKNWLTNDVVGARNNDNDLAHPMFCYYAALNSMGVSLEELFAIFDATSEDGVMFGEAEIELKRAMKPGSTYVISGQVTAAQRKKSKKLGTFDLVDFELNIHEDDQLVGISRNSFIFPRELTDASE